MYWAHILQSLFLPKETFYRFVQVWENESSLFFIHISLTNLSLVVKKVLSNCLMRTLFSSKFFFLFFHNRLGIDLGWSVWLYLFFHKKPFEKNHQRTRPCTIAILNILPRQKRFVLCKDRTLSYGEVIIKVVSLFYELSYFIVGYVLTLDVFFPVDFACLKRDFFSYLLVSSSFYVWKRIVIRVKKCRF